MESIGVFDELTNQLRAIEFDDDDDDYQDALADEEQAETTSTTLSKKLQDRRKKAKNRRRRRSSAQFLNLGEEDDDDQQPLSSANLGEVYQNAIRMNAENKINAANSWNLNLIDHLDQFVSSSSSKKKGDAGVNSIQEGIQQLSLESDDIGVNFTKASCTLDASVKIYSYRVDDVHLTSYKVLANLNRTETGKNSKKDDNAANTKDGEATTKTAATQNRKVSETETLEQNLGKCYCHCYLQWFPLFLTLFFESFACSRKPTSTFPSLTKPLTLTHCFTKCPRHLMKEVLRDSYWQTLECPTRDATLCSIRL